jgi:ectoine hydroxylase-related dioxygenase (phytanoyl-CoA dioxygenase family)
MDAFEAAVLHLRLHGYVLLPALLGAAECAEARRELDRVLADYERQAGGGRPTHGWAYNMMNKARVYERLYQVPELLRLVRFMLGDDAVLQGVMARRVDPGAPEQGLHYDGSLTGPFRAASADDGDRRNVETVFGLNVIWCLSEFTPENGATRLVPGSHRFPGRAIPRETRPPGEIQVVAEPGTVLVFNIATWHGQSAHTGTVPRYAALTPWRRAWVRPEVDLSRMVAPEVLERAGPEGRVIFGFTARPPYTERWQWDAAQGRPRPEWAALARDEPLG